MMKDRTFGGLNTWSFHKRLSRAFLLLACGALVAIAQDSQKAIIKIDFEKAPVGSVPEEFFVLDGGFSVREEGGNKFLELPGAPLDSFGALFGPTERHGVSVSARIHGTMKGRRYPVFGIGVNGGGGYKLLVSPAKKLIELYRGDAVKTTAPYNWDSGKWTHLRLDITKSGSAGFKITGKVWNQDGPEPARPTITFEDADEPPPGRASIWGSPFAGTPIRYDDLAVSSAN